ncbi:hypothetical protein CNMCM5623_007231 [Aspergillus felis]|uniref:F-box domain-containing protein n=1 Tax=Aspergillus felis TaxID=1287682 RepID=A0A8H6URR1_9EURO|nr:hypothetical protein CNMCM5623_007231 [Aspergillus felis]KAF7183318.1 hypothetical protein CNMCM7691_003231 [Aspergillus felis]
MEDSQNRPTLEGLPVELQISILFNIDDLNSLRSLVFASPIYHRAYQLVRQELLYVLLQSSYNGLVDIADAVAAVRSRGLYAIKPSNRAKIIALLDSQRRSEEIHRLGLSSWPFPDEPADIEETIQLLHLHRMATYLLDDYTRTAACPKWMDLDKWKNEILPLTLSRTEQRRFLRAFYRMQIYGNIFGDIEISLGADDVEEENDWFADTHGRTPTFTDEEAWRLFFGPMAPWEVEEFTCFWRHCHHRWAEPYLEISKSLAAYAANGAIWFSDLPPEEQPPLNRCGLDVDRLHVHENEQREILAYMVPTFLVKMLREQDFRTRRDLLLANAVILNHSFVEYWPRPSWEEAGALPLLYPADRFNFGTDVSGLKAYLETLPPHERPNVAWTQRWLDARLDYPQVFEDMYSYAKYSHWDWGYAIWDDERLIEWGAMDHLDLP